MENEEKEDLLKEVVESEEETCEKEEEIDDLIRQKILNYVESEKNNAKAINKGSIVVTCLLIFLSSSVLVIVLPIYVKYSTVYKVSTYGKLVTVSITNAFLFGFVHLIKLIPLCSCHSSVKFPFFFLDVLKISLLLCLGNISLFCLLDKHHIRCHLEDPLKGFSIVFSLLFYYLFSQRKMSVERTLCAITIIVGVFISVDFGICDKFRCNGLPKATEQTPKFHFLYVLLYLLLHGAWVLHLTMIEVCWTTCKDSETVANPSHLSNVFAHENSEGDNLKHLIQSLSVIYQEESGEQDSGCNIENSVKSKRNNKTNLMVQGQNRILLQAGGKSSEHTVVNCLINFSQLSFCDTKKFPVTSTPKNETKSLPLWSSVKFFDVALWQHIISCFIILCFCWLPTISFLNEGKPKLLVDVISEVIESFRCHLGWSGTNQCGLLPSITIAFSVTYVIFILSSLELLKIVQSTVTVVSIMMPALPVSSLFWSMFRMNDNFYGTLEFSPEITGEAVCAILGLPIIGIGIVLLLKTYMRRPSLTA